MTPWSGDEIQSDPEQERVPGGFMQPCYEDHTYIEEPGTNMVEYLHEAKASRPYPNVLTLGNDDQRASQSFVTVAGQALEHDALLQAIDVCFKSFFILDIKYRKQYEHVWEFLQSAVYEMPGGESKLFLQTRIAACK